MCENLNKKLFENMSYNLYDKLFEGSYFSLYSSVFLNAFIGPGTASNLLTGYSLLALAYFSNACFNDCELYTRDVVQIRNLYNTLLNEYTNLINQFELKHPIEIYQMYNYMLFNGYLSDNSRFYFDDSDTHDINGFLGVNVVTGKAVCRHIASMLKDIYNNIGISSQLLPMYIDRDGFFIREYKESISITKLLSQESNDEDIKKECITFINNIEKKIYELEKQLSKRKKSNHAITLVGYDDTCYLLDSTNQTIFQKDSSFNEKDVFKSLITSPKNGVGKVCQNTFLSEFKKAKEDAKSNLLLKDSNDEENTKIINNTNNLCSKNIDLIEQFSVRNEELYSEINNSLYKIKKKVRR